MVPDERIGGMEWMFSWECTSVVVVAALGIAIGVLANNDFKLWVLEYPYEALRG